MRSTRVRIATKAHIFLSALLATSLTFANTVPDPEIRTVDGAKEIWINTPDGSKKLGSVEEFPKGSTLYHWDSVENAARWAAQGKVKIEDIEALNRGEGLVGGGFYVSKDSWDSSFYAQALTTFTTTQDTAALTFSDSIGRTAISDWNAFNQKLVRVGIDGVGRYGNNPTWYNFVDDKPFLNARAGTWNDVETSDYLKNAKLDLFKLLEVNSKVPLQETSWIKANHPMVSEILHHTLDISKLESELKQQIIDWLIDSSHVADQTLLTSSLRTLFRSDVIATLKSSYDQVRNQASTDNSRVLVDWSESAKVLESNMIASRKLGIPYSAWLPEVNQPPVIFRSIEKPVLETEVLPTFPYSKTLNEHLKYLDIDDFLHTVAQWKPIDKIYDSAGLRPYSERWMVAALPSTSRQGGAIAVNRALTGSKSSDFRDSPAASDGDIVWQGKKYFQVNDEQSQALKKNPFIASEFQTITDPQHPGETIHVARYEYPTAIDFEKFSNYLSPILQQKLNAAKSAGELRNPTADSVRALTKQMLSELADQIAAGNLELSPSDTKLFLLSIHPFNEMNTETAAVFASTAKNQASSNQTNAFYKFNRSIPGRPDEPLLMTRESFHALALEDSINAVAIQRAFARAERINPSYPKYFDVPELWQVGRNMPNIGSDPAAFVQQSKEFYSSANAVPCAIKYLDAHLK